MTPEPALVKFDAARAALAAAHSVDEVKLIRDQAEAMRAYIKQQRGSLEMQNHAAEIKIRAERRLGEMLADVERSIPGRPAKNTPHDGGNFERTVTNLGIGLTTAERWQEMARVPEPVFEQFVQDTKANSDELTSAAVQRLARGESVHFSSDSPEWYTPSDILRRVVATLGQIDLDPCSNSEIAPNVPAREHFTEALNGLNQPWCGTVFMNPPYGREIDEWIGKLIHEYLAARTEAAIALVPARTDTGWWARLEAFPVCLIRGRLKFISPDGCENSAPFPSAAFYLGPDYQTFHDAFHEIGGIWRMDWEGSE